MFARVATIDPGLHTMGVAIWNLDNFLAKNALAPTTAMDLKRDSFKNYFVAVRDLFTAWNIQFVLIENPEHQSGVRGTVASKTGSVIKLAEFVGMIMTIAFQRGATVDLINVSSWKGNLPKEVVGERVERVWPECPFTFKNDAMDAIGIGLWAQGLINTQLMAYQMPTKENLLCSLSK